MGWTVMAGGDSMCEGASARCKHRSMTEKNGWKCGCVPFHRGCWAYLGPLHPRLAGSGRRIFWVNARLNAAPGIHPTASVAQVLDGSEGDFARIH